jgi:DNA-binding response OmpR family regulator
MNQKPSVLVIDDESGILDTLRILLKKEGFEVLTAQGGKAGLDQIRAAPTTSSCPMCGCLR